MKSLVLFAVLALGACASPASRQPTDVGNMAYPPPVAQGNTGTTMPPRVGSTGSSSYQPNLPQGNIATTVTQGPRRPTDTGNMAYPRPGVSGTGATTIVR